MSARVRRTVTEAQKEIIRCFAGLTDRHQSWQVWADFIEMTAISISNAVDPTDTKGKREKRYMDIVARYTPTEQKVFPEMVTILVDALESNPDQDFLGELFMALELGNHWKGQFFTPYNVCRMMAEMQCRDAKQKVEAQGWISVNDPACGAGALLVAARNVFLRDGVGFDQALFIAQDIDRVAGMMCYIQLSLLGCAGYVCIADTLCNPITGHSVLFPRPRPDQEVWYTPMWFADVWQKRRMWHGMDLLITACPAPDVVLDDVVQPPVCGPGDTEPEEPEIAPEYATTKTGQLALF